MISQILKKKTYNQEDFITNVKIIQRFKIKPPTLLLHINISVMQENILQNHYLLMTKFLSKIRTKGSFSK